MYDEYMARAQTGGLVGKIFLAAAGVGSSLWLLLITLVIGTVIGLLYYLRIVISIFRESYLQDQMILPIRQSALGTYWTRRWKDGLCTNFGPVSNFLNSQ